MGARSSRLVSSLRLGFGIAGFCCWFVLVILVGEGGLGRGGGHLLVFLSEFVDFVEALGKDVAALAQVAVGLRQVVVLNSLEDVGLDVAGKRAD